MAEPIDYQAPAVPSKPRTRWWLIVLLIVLVPLFILVGSYLILGFYRIGPGD